jgi:hypothetical protein
LLLWGEEVPRVDVHVVPEVLLEAVVVAAVLAPVTAVWGRRRFGEVTPAVTLLSGVKVRGAALVPGADLMKPFRP